MQLLSVLGTIVSLFIAITSFYIARKKDAVTSNEELNKRFKELEDRIAKECGEKYASVDKRLSLLEDKMNPIWGAIMKEIPNLLISPHTPQLDALMRKGINFGWECLEPSEIALLDELIDQEVTRLRLAGIQDDAKSKARIAAFAAVKAGIEAQRKLAAC